MTSQRDFLLYTLAPPWLREGAGEKYVYNLGLMSDAMLQKAFEAAVSRMPGLGTSTALPYIGADRVMPQGPNESDDSFARRLRLAFETWQHAGSRPAILRQAMGYVGDADAEYSSGDWVTGAIVHPNGGAGGPGTAAAWSVFFSFDDFLAVQPMPLRSGYNWNWDGEYRAFQAFLILYFPPYDLALSGSSASIDSWTDGFATLSGLSGLATDLDYTYTLTISGSGSGNDGVYQVSSDHDASTIIIAGSAITAPDTNNGSLSWSLARYRDVAPGPPLGQSGITWGDPSLSIGLNVSAGYVQQLQGLLRRWHCANTFYPAIVFSFDGGDGSSAYQFSPYGTAGTNNPNGDWGLAAKIVDGIYVPSRKTNVAGGSTPTAEQWSVCTDGTQYYYPDSYLPSGT